jgi:hypothetical protein
MHRHLLGHNSQQNRYSSTCQRGLGDLHVRWAVNTQPVHLRHHVRTGFGSGTVLGNAFLGVVYSEPRS